MSNKPRLCLELFHRDEITLQKGGLERLGWAIYHWAILIRSKDIDQLASSVSIDVTDGPRLDGVNRINHNPANDWWFRVNRQVNPLRSGHFLVCIDIGKVPKDLTIEDVVKLLSTLPLPQKNQTPDQNCATWVFHAVQAFQQAGWVSEKDTQKIMRSAMELASEVIEKGPPKKEKDRFKSL